MNRQELFKILKRFKTLNENKYGILTLGVFGSYVRGEATSCSDVDIVLTMRTADPFYVVHIKEELEEQLKLPVDIVRKRERMNPVLKKQIEKEAVYV